MCALSLSLSVCLALLLLLLLCLSVSIPASVSAARPPAAGSTSMSPPFARLLASKKPTCKPNQPGCAAPPASATPLMDPSHCYDGCTLSQGQVSHTTAAA